MNLKYLFKVEYTDGSTFKQNKKDISVTDSKRSAFYDVLQSKKEIKRFSLKSFLNKWSINLQTGEFTHNGYKFIAEEIPTEGKKELVFFRQHQHDFNQNGKETDHRVTYFLGWKKGKKQQVIGIK